MSTLIITEKKDVADNMAKAMGWPRGQGGYEGRFEGKPVKVVWARGHLLKLASPDTINPALGWSNPEALESIPRDVPMEPVEEPGVEYNRTAKALLDNIGRALKGASEVILATDSDREGEYIGWSILEHHRAKLPVRRCWLAAGMDEKSIKQALDNLLPEFEKKPLARAAEARARCDWSYMHMVRAMTFYGRQGHLGKHLGTGQGRQSVVSVGRVQSAALFMIYKREMEIRNFTPKTFYAVQGNFSVVGNQLSAEYAPGVTQEIIDQALPGIHWEPQGLDGEGKLDKPMFVDKALVDAFKDRLLSASGAATVLEYKEGTREQHPPITYDLVEAKSALSKATGVSGELAQAIIEDLYEQGFISYPRTAHGELPINLYEPEERDTRLKCIAGINELSTPALKAMAIHGGTDSEYKPFIPKVFVKKKLEHYGLIPSMREVSEKTLKEMQPRKKIGTSIQHTSQHMQAAYRLIATRYVQAMLPPAKLATQRITFSVPVQDLLGQETSIFISKAERTIDPGWRALMNAGEEKTTELPKLKNGQPASVDSIDIREGKTKSPKRYSEENIEKALQKAAREVNDPQLRKYLSDGTNKPEGIGTPATRKDIIPTLKIREYIRSDKAGAFFLEPKGEEFIEYHLNNKHDWLYRIETTAQWEGRLSELALLENDSQATDARDAFIEETIATIENYIAELNRKYLNKKSTRPETGNSLPTTVTDKMKDTIRSIAAKKSIPIPRGALSAPEKAKAFLDEHLGNRSGKPETEGETNSTTQTMEPSPQQLALAEKIEKATGVKMTDDERSDRRKLSSYIEKNKATLDEQPPTEKMIKFAKSIAEKLGEKNKPAENVFKSMKACRAFLDKHTKTA